MFELKKFNSFQVELSTFCNVACPLCPRHYMGTSVLLEGLRQKNITLAQWLKFLNDVDKVTTDYPINMVFCGCHGDPPMAPDWEEIIIETAKRPYIIDVETNGSMRSPESWARVGEVFAKTEKEQSSESSIVEKVITFSIDGLEDTNKLYRIGIKHDRVMANAKAFIDAGGRARWKMIVFKHNEHQVEECKQLAKDMGFWEFDTHISTRNWEYNYAEVEKKNKKYQINYREEENNTNKGIKIETDLRKAKKQTISSINDKDGNPVQGLYEIVGDEFEKSETKLDLNISDQGAENWKEIVANSDLSTITCDFKESRNMYIDSEMNLWPCNYIAGTRHEDPTHMNKLIKEYGEGWNNLFEHDFRDVFKHDYFQNVIRETWKDTSHKLCTNECQSMCGGGIYRQAWDTATNREEI